MKITEVVSGVGRVFGHRRPEKAFAPSELSSKAQEIWGVCDHSAKRIFRECKLGRLVVDPYLRSLLMVGFQSTVLGYEFHEQGDSFGQGKPVSPEVFNEVSNFFVEKRLKLAQNPKLNNPNSGNPSLSWLKVVEFQDVVVDECQKIFEKFYGCRKLWMYKFSDVKMQVRESVDGVIIPKMAKLINVAPSLTVH